MTLKLCGMPWRPNLEKLGEPWLTSNWSTWWKFNSLIWQICCLRSKNYWIILNAHSKLSEDLATFMFCSSLPKSYEPTAQQYLDNIMVIANYKLTEFISWGLQEESRRKAQSLGKGLSLNKFSTGRNLGQKCAKCGKSNHTTQNHWPGGKHPQNGKGQSSQEALSSSGNKNKAKEKAQGSANVLDIMDLPKLSITSSESTVQILIMHSHRWEPTSFAGDYALNLILHNA